MKDFLWRFALIGGFTLAGLLYIWPPKERLKLGIYLIVCSPEFAVQR